MFTSQDLLNGVRMTQLNDPDATTWTDSTLIVALNQSLRLLTSMRPDATSKIAVIGLSAGSRQFVPADGMTLLSVIRNINANGSVGDAVRLVSQEGMDNMSPDWHNVVGLTVKEYMFDNRSPLHFYVYPSVPEGTKVEIEYSSYLEAINESTVNKDLPVSAIYFQPLQELMLYSLLGGALSNSDSSQVHLDVAKELLNIKDRADVYASGARNTDT